MSERRWYIVNTVIAYPMWVLMYTLIGIVASHTSPHDATTIIDTSVPFFPNAIWMYMSVYFFPLFIVLTTRDLHRLNVSIIALFFVHIVSFWIFCNWPVITQKPVLGHTLAQRLVKDMYQAESQPWVNNFPSLHVSFSLLLAASYFHQGHGRFREWCIALWAASISLSTLLVKQHLFVDVIGASLLSTMTWYVADKSYKRYLNEYDAKESILLFFRQHRRQLVTIIIIATASTLLHRL